MTLDEANFTVRFPFHPDARPSMIEGEVGRRMRAATPMLKRKSPTPHSKGYNAASNAARTKARLARVEDMPSHIQRGWFKASELNAIITRTDSIIRHDLRHLVESGRAQSRIIVVTAPRPGRVMQWRAL